MAGAGFAATGVVCAAFTEVAHKAHAQQSTRMTCFAKNDCAWTWAFFIAFTASTSMLVCWEGTIGLAVSAKTVRTVCAKPALRASSCISQERSEADTCLV